MKRLKGRKDLDKKTKLGTVWGIPKFHETHCEKKENKDRERKDREN